MRLAAMALATLFAFSGTCVFAHTLHHRSNVRAHALHRPAATSVVPRPKYDNPNGNFSAYGNHDVWGQWGGYYGPMITVGGGGR
jgi:hypothetical protein